MTMLLARDIALTEIFRAQAVQAKRDLKFYLESERTLDRHQIAEQREKEERASLERLEEASREQIAAFRDRLDSYDTAVVEALMDNEHALEQARKRREDIEHDAAHLPDGRMVFKSEDGRRVLDQDGKDAPSTVIAPESIPNKLPRAEAHRDAVNEERRLEREREQLHQFQGKLDDARERIDKGVVSAKELDALGDDLDKSMPDAVRHRMGRPAPADQPDGPQVGAPSSPAAAPPAGFENQRRSPAPSPFSPR